VLTSLLLLLLPCTAYLSCCCLVSQKLYWQTGCVNIGDPLFSQALATAVDQQLPHEVLTAQQANDRFPGAPQAFVNPAVHCLPCFSTCLCFMGQLVALVSLTL
jgi:hypothetical protein